MKQNRSMEEKKEFLAKVRLELDPEKLTSDEKALKTGFNTLYRLIDKELECVSRKMDSINFNDSKELSTEALKDFLKCRMYRGKLIEAWDMIHAILDGTKHPINEYIEAARSVFGRKGISYREIRFRAVCVGFMEAYQAVYETSIQHSAKVVQDTLKSVGDRHPNVNQLKSYYQTRDGFALLGETFVSGHKQRFEIIASEYPKNLFFELRFLVLEYLDPHNVHHPDTILDFKKMRTPPSSHLQR